ncbi:MAG: hypothetical protein UY11_C0048G0001, partial [Candidatus Amesbacteria bacterium GW2011_GWC2_47_8]
NRFRPKFVGRAEFPPHPPSARLALPARPKLLSEGGNRSGKDDFKFFFGGKFLIKILKANFVVR